MPLPLGASVFAGQQGSSQRGSMEPQREYDAELSISGIPGFSRAAGDDYITLSVLSFSFPAEESEVQGFLVGNERRHFPGATTYQPIPVVIRDMVDQDTAAVLLRWRRSVYDGTPFGYALPGDLRDYRTTGSGTFPRMMAGLPSSYKKRADLHLLAPDSAEPRRFVLTGVWPSAISFGEANQESAGFNNIKMTLQYDTFLSTTAFITGI